MEKNILVTGGAGFIGSNFVLMMVEKYPEYKIVNLDALTYAGNLENLRAIEKKDNYHFIQADICDLESVEKVVNEHQINEIVNFAAESHVDRSILYPDIFVKTNVLGTLNLLTAAKKFWMENPNGPKEYKFVQVSTDEVYGSLGETGFFVEETPIDAHSPYSASKAGADLLVNAYADTYKMPINITRCSNNYGPYQFPEKLIPLIINNALNKKSLPVYGDGLHVRDWLYVEDHCKAIDLVLHKGIPGEVYNVGGHNERKNIEIVKLIIQYLHDKVDAGITEELITYVEDRKGHDRRYGIDPAKIGRELGWKPETSFEVGRVKTIDWYLANMEWMKNVTSGAYQNYYSNMYKG